MKKLYFLCITAFATMFLWTSGHAQQSYCTPVVGSQNVEPITSVVYAGINNTTDATIDGTSGLEDFTSMIAYVEPGAAQTISLQGNTNGAFTSNFTVFIDWNQNGTLNDAGEVYQIGSVSNSNGTDGQMASNTILVPTDALLGDTRMRIIKNYSNFPSDPCSDYSYAAAEDYTVNVAIASCPVPKNLTVDAVTEVTADISWATGSGESDWVVYYGPAGFDATDTSAYMTKSVSDSPSENLTGLDPGTNYDFYVQALCGGVDHSDDSNFAGPGTFITQCASIGDFVENFDTTDLGGIPNCWNTLKVNSTSSFAKMSVASYSNAISPPNIFKFSNSVDTMAEFYLIAPKLNNLTDPNHQLRFNFEGAYTVADALLEVGVMGDPTDESTFTSVESVSITSDFEEYTVAFDNGSSDIHIAFKITFSGDYATLYLDNVNWEPIPDCPKPQGLTVDEVTGNTADISWTAGGSETQWQVKYGASGFDPGTEGMSETLTGPPSSTQLTGLNPGTEYEFYIRSLCGSGDQSDFSGPKVFFALPANNNLCDAISMTFGATSLGDAYTNKGATQQTDELNGTCWLGTSTPHTVWFSFVAPTSGEVRVTTDIAGGTLTDTHIAIYEAPTDCSDMTTLGNEVGCDEDSGDIVVNNSVVSMTGLTGGDTYYVQVGGYGSDTGTFGLEVSDDNPLSVYNDQADYSIQLYPNPAQSGAAFYVTSGQFKDQRVSVSITDLLGKTVYSSTKDFNAGQIVIQPGHPLGSGVYFVNLSQDGKVVNKRVIIK